MKKMFAALLAMMLLVLPIASLAEDSYVPDRNMNEPYKPLVLLDGEEMPILWYGNNTMSLVGLSLRDLYPDLTDKWYQIVPVDLTQEGTLTLSTVVSNLYYMGSCTVKIADGTVTTDYTIPTGYVYPQEQCLMWFTDINDITSEFLENPVGSYSFGQPVSIQDDLNGKDIAILFICNHLNYRIPLTNSGRMPIEFWRGSSKVTALEKDLTALLQKMEEEPAEESEGEPEEPAEEPEGEPEEPAEEPEGEPEEPAEEPEGEPEESEEKPETAE